MPIPLLVHPANRPDETWSDPKRGDISWRTLLSAGVMDSDTFTAGIASLAAGDRWAIHRHAEAELYFGLTGEAEIEVEGKLYRLKPEALLFIPGNAFHGIPLTKGPLRFFYVFATDQFDTIKYTFRGEE
jgi:quercetin dioxygenase-like cupin family protein